MKHWAIRVKQTLSLLAIRVLMGNSVRKLATTSLLSLTTQPCEVATVPIQSMTKVLDVREKTLIKNGILTDYLNHRETAHHFGIEPNAGARAQDGLHHPLVRMSNTMIMGALTPISMNLQRTSSTVFTHAVLVEDRSIRVEVRSNSQHKKRISSKMERLQHRFEM